LNVFGSLAIMDHIAVSQTRRVVARHSWITFFQGPVNLQSPEGFIPGLGIPLTSHRGLGSKRKRCSKSQRRHFILTIFWGVTW
jgi:hypothetical protein